MNRSVILISMFFLWSCHPEKKQESSTPKSASTKVGSETKDANKKTILFFGNSITAGYQLDLSEAFPALIQERLDSLGLDYLTVNAGLSGETTASGNSRVEWVMKNAMDIFVLELGANDGLRGISTEETKKNLEAIIEKVRKKYPDCKILLAGMMIPPNMGQEYSESFQKIYPDLAKKFNIPLIPFLLEGVAGVPELNLEDGIHPTPEGHQILAENVWSQLAPIL
ncbi:acyl-CoA thioesterase-1 [Reichenbachiella faecimaris]|uniref:Acyl-CoA thioesterase-1 n=1 Tax=Reichenbachiella faecimaris TaxID=692418 RepID=A0A1W2GBL1_REIFA|nr:arylesterase [Reichenbachiella faecimaris]SMD34047.1 acyl-CoA thioesterase-1 [Reichenbachiella faecimaris]